MVEGNTSERVIASAWTDRRGQRPWHVQTLFVREPGDLTCDRLHQRTGPHREGEEPQPMMHAREESEISVFSDRGRYFPPAARWDPRQGGA